MSSDCLIRIQEKAEVPESMKMLLQEEWLGSQKMRRRRIQQ